MIKGNTKKLAIIGAGTVGTSIAYSVMLSEMVSEIVLIDINKNKALGEAADMNHGLSFVKQMNIRAGEYEDLKDADVVVITAGVNRKPGQTRLDLARINISIVKDITDNIVKYAPNAIVLVVSNPVDILTYAVQKFSGFPKNQVFGSGTALDTGRFRYLISECCKVDVTNVHSYIIGEHGDSEVPVWSTANIAGKKFEDFYKMYCNGDCTCEMQKIENEVKTAGAKIIELKKVTNYGIALSVRRILKAIYGNENSIIPVSSVMDGSEYGISDVALSLPSVINSNGIDRIFHIDLNETEMQKLKESEQKLKEVLNQVL